MQNTNTNDGDDYRQNYAKETFDNRSISTKESNQVYWVDDVRKGKLPIEDS